MISLREALEEHIDKLNEGKIDLLKQSNVLNLLKVYLANMTSMTSLRIELVKMLSKKEVQLIQAL